MQWTCHISHETIHLLQERFGESIISRHGPVNYPPRSCDLKPLDFFLWGHVKSFVYTNRRAMLHDLQTNIERVIVDILAELCENVMENWIQRGIFFQARCITNFNFVMILDYEKN